MKKIAVQDANILIDLVNAGMVDDCMKLEYKFITTSFVISEIDEYQLSVLQPHIDSTCLEILTLDEDEIVTVQQIISENHILSAEDVSVYLLALRVKATLLTGDNNLRKYAVSHGVDVCGILWLLDQMIASEIISTSQATLYLQTCLNKKSRLPKKDCDDRFESWVKDNGA